MSNILNGKISPAEAVKGLFNGGDYKNVMGLVAEDYVESAYRNFYENTNAGKYLDNNAHGIFKSDGLATGIIAPGIGKVVGIGALTALTGGTGTAAIATSAGIAGTAATGQYTEEYWKNARDSADSGKEWTTKENYNKGMIYGAANGAWEAVQWYVGGKLNNFVIKDASQLANSAARVAIDTGFNALDTPYRTLVDSATSDRTLQEAWEKQGGWESVFTNAGIGLIGSLGGEIFNGLTKGKADKTMQNTESSLKENIQQSKEQMSKYFNNHPEFGITDEQLENRFGDKNILIFRNNDDFDQFAIQTGVFSEEEIKYVGAYACNNGPR